MHRTQSVCISLLLIIVFAGCGGQTEPKTSEKSLDIGAQIARLEKEKEDLIERIGTSVGRLTMLALTKENSLSSDDQEHYDKLVKPVVIASLRKFCSKVETDVKQATSLKGTSEFFYALVPFLEIAVYNYELRSQEGHKTLEERFKEVFTKNGKDYAKETENLNKIVHDDLLKPILENVPPEQRLQGGLLSLIFKDLLDLLGIVGEISELKQKQSFN